MTSSNAISKVSFSPLLLLIIFFFSNLLNFWFRSLWNKHKRKVFVSLGVSGGAYVLYKLYNAHKQRTIDLEKELESQREVDELIKAQL